MQVTYNNFKESTITKEKNPVAEGVTKEIFAPVLCDFIGWVLLSANASGLKRLYFLARDGWLMCGTAKLIAKKYNLDIDLRYLYCSRLSLRNAALSDLGEEAYRYLLEGGFALTPKVILSRLRLNYEQRKSVYEDIAFDGDEDTEMGKAAAAEFCAKLKGSAVYNNYIKEVSEASKETALGYLKQEGLTDQVPYGIVDSGWTGSMEKMLSILTGRKQHGLYFGLYSSPDLDYGEYNSFLFNKSTSPLLVSRFNNHLFEALCGAPHGMTVGYELKNGGYIPKLKESNSFNFNSDLLLTQQQVIFRYAEEAYVLPEKIPSIKERQRKCFPLLDRLMYSPSINIAENYGKLSFSDDPGELYSFSLAAPLEQTERMYFLPRLKEKLFQKGELTRPLYWGYGTAVLSGKGKFCRANLRLWEIMWLLKR